jgi:hypothetical protein
MVRPWSYYDQWQEWVVDDFIGGYIDRLTEFGVQPPRRLAQADEDVRWSHRTLAQAFAAMWPLNFWRSDAMGPADFEESRTTIPAGTTPTADSGTPTASWPIPHQAASSSPNFPGCRRSARCASSPA